MPRQTNRARSILARAAAHGLYANKEGEGAPASPPSPPPPPAPPGKPPKEEPKPGALQLTQEELDAKVKSALDAERDKTAKEREKEKADRDADEAKKRGEFEKLYQGEVDARKKDQAEKDALKLDLRRTQITGRLRDFIAENHADYSAAAKYIAPLLTITADTNDIDADKQIKASVEQYVKDNPRAKSFGPGPSHQHKLPAGEKAPPKQDQRERVRPSGPASRF